MTKSILESGLVAAVFMLMALMVISESQAEDIKKGAPFCFTEDHFDQLVTAINKADKNAINYLVNTNKCSITNNKFEVTVLDRTWSGKVKVRMYSGNANAEVWTYMEMVD